MKTLCINLDSRPDRWAQASAEFERVGLTVERVSAVSGDNKTLAFNQSVYKCMQMARGHDLLLFEDDVVFDCPYVQIREVDESPYAEMKYVIKFDEMIKGKYGKANASFINSSDLSFHLGCNIMGQWKMPERSRPLVGLLHNCWQSHATYYSAECVDLILANLDPTYIDENNCIFDEWFRRNVLPMGRSYVMKPMIAYQRPSFSDIWNTFANYEQCHIDGNKYLATL